MATQTISAPGTQGTTTVVHARLNRDQLATLTTLQKRSGLCTNALLKALIEQAGQTGEWSDRNHPVPSLRLAM